jgi:hypothetical protein
MRKLLSLSSRLNYPGLYRFDPVSLAEARAWLDAGYHSLVYRNDIARRLTAWLGRPIPATQGPLQDLCPGDEALVIQLPKTELDGDQAPARLSLLSYLPIPGHCPDMAGPLLVRRTLAQIRPQHRLVLKAANLWEHGYYWYSVSDVGEAAHAADWLAVGPYTLHIMHDVARRLARQLALQEPLATQFVEQAEAGICRHRLFLSEADQALVCHAAKVSGDGYHLRMLTRIHEEVASSYEAIMRAWKE